LNFMSNKNTFLYSLLHIFNRSSSRNLYFKAHKTFFPASIPLPPLRQYTVGTSNTPMDQISIKTPNLKCRLYWCLKSLLTGDTVNHVGIYPLTFSLVHLPPLLPFPPLPCVNKYRGTCIQLFMQCVGGGGIGGLRQKNTCHQVPLLVIFKKSRYRVWCLYSYLVHEYPPPPSPPPPP
jgi:hypothetical protein